MDLLFIYHLNNSKFFSVSALPKSFDIAIEMRRKINGLSQKIYLLNTVKRYEAVT
jgi:hypothetical protein